MAESCPIGRLGCLREPKCYKACATHADADEHDTLTTAARPPYVQTRLSILRIRADSSRRAVAPSKKNKSP